LLETKRRRTVQARPGQMANRHPLRIINEVNRLIHLHLLYNSYPVLYCSTGKREKDGWLYWGDIYSIVVMVVHFWKQPYVHRTIHNYLGCSRFRDESQGYCWRLFLLSLSLSDFSFKYVRMGCIFYVVVYRLLSCISWLWVLNNVIMFIQSPSTFNEQTISSQKQWEIVRSSSVKPIKKSSWIDCWSYFSLSSRQWMSYYTHTYRQRRTMHSSCSSMCLCRWERSFDSLKVKPYPQTTKYNSWPCI